MKRVVAGILALILCFTCGLALAEYTLMLIEKPEYLSGLALCSISPDGGTLLCVDHENSGAVLVDALTGARTRVWADYERSVDDVYGRLEYMSGILSTFITGPNAVKWSPDGRLISITNWNVVVMQGRFINDLFLIDARTGALRDYQTYTSGRTYDSGAVLSTCFSADGKYLYYIAFRPTWSLRTQLNRLEIETGECEHIRGMGHISREGARWCDLSDLQITPGGELVAAMSATYQNLMLGLYTVRPAWYGWKGASVYVMDNPCLTAPPNTRFTTRYSYLTR